MNITILGCGVYGLALADCFLQKNNNRVMVWNKFEKEILEVKEKYLGITFTTDMESAIKEADLIVIAIPVAFLNSTVMEMKDLYKGQDILIASKGIDVDSQRLAFEIVKDILPDCSLGVISGGTFAKDMSEGNVMGLTLATDSEIIKNKVKLTLENEFLRIQYISDIVGTSICGAIKNVMAIGFGMLDGAMMPPSSRFLFLTEAIYEIKNLIKELGGDSNTIMSYAGLDDIMMTCTSSQSRNYTMGSLIGKNTSKEEIEEYKKNNTIEGLGTTKAIYLLALNKDIDLPMTNTIYNILYNDGNANDLIELLKNE